MNSGVLKNSLQKRKTFRVGIDCRMWDETGIGRYIRNIVAYFPESDSEIEFVLFFLPKNMETLNLPSNFKKVPANIRWHTFAEQVKLPIIFLRENLDLLFVPHFNVPILYPRKFIAVVHDLTILRIKTGRATTLPYPVYFLKRIAFKINVLSTIYRARALFTVSNYVREDLIKSFGLKDKEIVVTPCAVSSNFRPISSEDSEEVLNKYSIKKPYLFYVGNAHPHKNLESLLKAFILISKEREDLSLVLGGKKEFFYERLQNEIKNSPISEKVVFTGFVDDEDLPALYSQSEAFVNPSLYEGFGIQILEAFACGTKVICSNTTSLPEVGGKVAFYFDPKDPQDMASKILSSLEIPYESDQGYFQVRKFSWEKSAHEILKKIYDVLEIPYSLEGQHSEGKVV